MHALIVAKNASAIRVNVASKDQRHTFNVNPFVSTLLLELDHRNIEERDTHSPSIKILQRLAR